jgi:hypothetical protein
MKDRFEIRSIGDLEAVTIAETFDLLAGVFGPYCFTVTGSEDAEQAYFGSSASHTLFFLKANELIAVAKDIAVPGVSKKDLSLIDAGEWLAAQFAPNETGAGVQLAISNLQTFLNEEFRIRFWSGALGYHLQLKQSFAELLRFHANFEKHSLLKLSVEVRRLRAALSTAGCELSYSEVLVARDEFSAHIKGMMEYHATELAEMLGHYFIALFRLASDRVDKSFEGRRTLQYYPAGITDEFFQDLYSSAILTFSGWPEERIVRFIPKTASILKLPYPQHEDVD